MGKGPVLLIAENQHLLSEDNGLKHAVSGVTLPVTHESHVMSATCKQLCRCGSFIDDAIPLKRMGIERDMPVILIKCQDE